MLFSESLSSAQVSKLFLEKEAPFTELRWLPWVQVKPESSLPEPPDYFDAQYQHRHHKDSPQDVFQGAKGWFRRYPGSDKDKKYNEQGVKNNGIPG
jgi:hypothetical protein